MTDNPNVYRYAGTVWVKDFKNYTDKKFFQHLKETELFKLIAFQREYSEKKGFHWQCFLILKKRKRLIALSKMLRDAYLEKAKGTDEENLIYCQKEVSKAGSFFFWKEEQKERKKLSKKVDLELFIAAIKEKKYSWFDDLRDLSEEFFWNNRNLLKSIWNEYNPIPQIEISPCKTIWLFGKSGAGKSVWTKQYLKKHNYEDKDITNISPEQMTGMGIIYFDISHENKKVLVINEVDKEFPKYNYLISYIDRNVLLKTKGAGIRNNFELIVINSIFKPEEVFTHLEKNITEQILRRLYDQNVGCKVYEIRANLRSLQKCNKLSGLDFLNEYRPIEKEVSQVQKK